MTPQEKAASIAHWQRHNISPGTKARACPYCGHAYLMPCEEAEHAGCANFLASQRRANRRTEEAS